MPTDRIRTAYQRNRRALEHRPGKGQGTAKTTVRLTGGLACEVEDGPWRLRTDMAEAVGGTGAAPTPGVLARGALGACLAVCYAQVAAVEGLALEGLTVEIEADYDARGETGFREVSAGYREVRVRVRLATDASPDEAERVAALAEANSSVFDVFRTPQPIVRDLAVVPPAQADVR